MKKFKHFIKEQSQSSSSNVDTIRKCFEYFSREAKKWQDAPNLAKETFKKDNFQKINFLKGLSPVFTILKENPEDFNTYLSDSDNREYAKNSIAEIRSMLQDAYGSEARAVGTLQNLEDVEKSLEQLGEPAADVQEIPASIKDRLDSLGLEY